ncbi:MAG: GMC family oxidoreductase [Kofleriaceae bacterium]|nr:GMC family oxidoreductase [Kofleriaceae bacterium]
MNSYLTIPACLFALTFSCSQSIDGDTIQCGEGKCDSFDTGGCVGPACGALEETEFDFIIVGSGAGGGTVAARLAEAGHTVLVLEAGVDAGSKPAYQIPVFHAIASEEPGLAWSYFVEHYGDPDMSDLDTKRTSKGILYPRGGTLGGSTAVNAMINVLPKPSDWARMATLTNDDSFSPSSMSEYENYLREWLPMEPPPFSGLVADIFEPELGVEAIDNLLDIIDATFIEMVNAGHDPGDWDFNIFDPFRKWSAYADFFADNINDHLRVGNVEGVFSFPQSIRNGKRRGSRERVLEALSTGNLTIKTQALVSRVLFANGTESGCDGPCVANEVEFLDGRGLYGAESFPSNLFADTRVVRVREGGEVIVSAGAFNTPQVLMQSGIGPAEELERFGIPKRVVLKGVGENLQDRYEVGIESAVTGATFGAPEPFIETEDCNFVAVDSDLCFKHWKESGEGLYSTNGGVVALMKRSGMTAESDLHIFGVPGPFRGYKPNYSALIPKEESRNLFTWVILKAHTDNRGGTVRLRCEQEVDGVCVVNPRATPDINFHYFHEGVEYEEGNPGFEGSRGERDLEAVVRGIEFVRDIEEQTNVEMAGTVTGPLLASKIVETWPGENFAPGETFSSERERLQEFVRREAWGHHASCSAPMGCIPAEEVGEHNKGAGICASPSDYNDNTVLDSRFRVRGTVGLRVIDASAFPRIPGTFILLPTYMLSEKGAQAILEDHSAMNR